MVKRGVTKAKAYRGLFVRLDITAVKNRLIIVG